MTEIRVPTLGESVTEATIGRWFKKAGDAVAVDEPLVELETDKVTIEVPAPSAGVLGEIAAKDGETVAVGALLGRSTKARGGAKPAARPPRPPLPLRAAAPAAARRLAADAPLAPSVRKLSAESGIDAATVPGSGKDGRVTKGDMLAAIEKAASAPTRSISRPLRAGARAVAGRRCRARGAREDDAAAPDHRAAAEGRAEHRGDADDLQRGRHDPHHGDARAVQGRVREEARLEARLHGLLHQGRRAGAEGHSRPSTPRSTAPT
jgi:pyruvate/2-oxoglutarate dehydrogenase complex dihydrolipoamide acyltransferase (E2) component